ncbi:MAG: hypothetical protein CSB55_02215 [Candidatus Cloacimonadota bacterium]|nr:MAG: hypothetical protein CSB55_02215 [Candidatus Cloacimonadota bacterium]
MNLLKENNDKNYEKFKKNHADFIINIYRDVFTVFSLKEVYDTVNKNICSLSELSFYHSIVKYENMPLRTFYKGISLDTDNFEFKEKQVLFFQTKKDGKKYFIATLKLHYNNRDGYFTFASEDEDFLKGFMIFYCSLAKTLRKYSEVISKSKSIKENMDLYRIITDNASDIIMRFDKKHRHIFVNSVAEKRLKIPQKEFIGKTHREMGYFSKEKCDFWEGEIQKVIDSGKSHKVFFDFEMEGEIFYLDWHLIPEFDDKGNVNSVLTMIRDITEIKMIQNALERSEKLFRKLFDDAPLGIILFKKDGKIFQINKHLKEILNYSEEEIKGSYIKDIIDLEISEDIEIIDEKPTDIWIKNKNGESIITSFIKTNIYDEETNYLFSIALLRDISQSYESAVTIKKLSQAISQSSESVVITDPEGRIEYANEKFYKISGYTPEEVTGVSTNFLNSGYSSKEDYFKLWDTIKTGKKWKGKFRNKAKDGSFFWESATISPVKNENNEIINFIAIKEDITQKIFADEALKDSEKRYRELRNAIPIGLLTLNFEGEIISSNNAAKKILDLNENAENDEYNLFSFIDNINVKNKILNCLDEKREIEDMDIYILNSQNKRLWIKLNIQFSNFRNGLIDCSIEDITEKVQTEMRLRRAEKMEALGTLTAGIAHDFNNVLMCLSGYADLAYDSLEEDSEVRNYISQIQASGERAAKMVNNLLAFSRNVKTDKKLIDSYSVIKKVIDEIKISIPKNIDFEIQLSKVSGFVLGDETDLYQVALNIITNAYQAITKEDGRILVKLYQKEVTEEIKDGKVLIKPDSYIVLSVSDNGSGIPDEIMEQIFDPFFTTKSANKGTGLGLAMAARVIKGMQGKIAVESELNTGTSFRIYLPSTAAREEEAESKSKTEYIKGEGNILLAEDEYQIGALMSKALRKMGYSVKYFDHPKAALRAFKNENNFDLIITDQIMPELKGTELIEKIRQINNRIPVILYSGYNDLINEDNYEKYKINCFMAKPVPLQKLSIKIKELLNAGKQ